MYTIVQYTLNSFIVIYIALVTFKLENAQTFSTYTFREQINSIQFYSQETISLA